MSITFKSYKNNIFGLIETFLLIIFYFNLDYD